MSDSKKVDPSTIPEVAALLDFVERNKKELESLRSLEDTRDTLLQSADKAVRAQGVSCGPFVLSHSRIRVDWDKLRSLVNKEEFQELGGIIQTQAQYSGDRHIFCAKMAAGEVPQHLQDAVVKTVSTYKVVREGW